ncbi:MAG: hypothetical protein AB7F75_06425 [Planctomycetota bacterium]
MSLRALVRGDVVHNEDEDQFEEEGVRHAVDFDEAALLPLLKKILPKIAKDDTFSRLSILSPDSLMELLEHGGEVDVSHIHDLHDEIQLLEKHLDSFKLKRSEADAFENFLSDLIALAQVSREVDAPIEFFQTEDDEDEDEDEEDDSEKQESEDLEDDEDLDDEDDEDDEEEDDEDEDDDSYYEDEA